MQVEFDVPVGLFSTQAVLGADGGSELVREALFVLHRPDPTRLEPAEFSARFRARPRTGLCRQWLVLLPFSLPELVGTSRFVEMSLQVRFDDPDACVLRMEPGRVQACTDPVPEADDILLPGRPPPGPLERGGEVVIWGESSADVLWRFRPGPGTPIREGSEKVWVVLELPAARTETSGSVDCEVKVARTPLGDEMIFDAKLTRRLEFRLALDGSQA